MERAIWLWGWLGKSEICGADQQEGQAEIPGAAEAVVCGQGISSFSGSHSSALQVFQWMESSTPT